MPMPRNYKEEVNNAKHFYRFDLNHFFFFFLSTREVLRKLRNAPNAQAVSTRAVFAEH